MRRPKSENAAFCGQAPGKAGAGFWGWEGKGLTFYELQMLFVTPPADEVMRASAVLET